MPELVKRGRRGLPSGYRWHEGGGICSLPWPDDAADLPPSLGPLVIAWAEGLLDSPPLVNPTNGEDWQFTKGQKRFLHLAYAVDENGRWLYNRLVKRAAKGAGKDPFGAICCIIEAAGPCRPAGPPVNGQVEGVEVGLPLVQIGANSEKQAKQLMWICNEMMTSDFRSFYGLDIGKSQTWFGNGGRIEIISNSESSAEGDPASFFVLNESHHMTRSSGRERLGAVARRNVAKGPRGQARILELTNAFMPGEDSVAERTFDSWQLQVSGQTIFNDVLYDSLEAEPGLSMSDPDDVRLGIRQAYAESPWVDVDRLWQEALDPAVPVTDSVRFYHNVIPENLDSWVVPSDWDACTADVELDQAADELVLFLDCSKSGDTTALVGCRVSDGAVFNLGAWSRPRGNLGDGWLAPREEVDGIVRHYLSQWKSRSLWIDPSPAKDDSTEQAYWQEMIDGLHRDYASKLELWALPGSKGHSVVWDMRNMKPGGRDHLRVFTEEAELTEQAISEHKLKHDGDKALRMHVINARRAPNQFGVSLGKQSRDSKQMVDLAVAMVGARAARRVLLNHRAASKKRAKRPVIVC